MIITIVLPCSRPEYLSKVFASLELLELKALQVNLLCIVDGNPTLYADVRNRTELSKFNQRLTVQYKSPKLAPGKYNTLGRRLRIPDIHNFAKEFIQDCDYVLLTEDDNTLPPDTIKKLYADILDYPYAGLISGVCVGRHGVKHLGLWTTDDVYNPNIVESIAMPEQPTVQTVDAAGLYCMLVKADLYKQHDFAVFENNALGCDVEFSLWIRQQGYSCYGDMSIIIPHLEKDRVILPSNVRLEIATFTKHDRGWRQKTVQA